MNCAICDSNTDFAFTQKVLEKYDANYRVCNTCGFLSAHNPIWLEEAYQNSITINDTGLLSRNIEFHKKLIVLIDKFFDSDDFYLDYAGGYGILTRLMRDAGFRFLHYDPLTENLFAKDFTFDAEVHKIRLITCFECFEHLTDPILELKKMLRISQNIFFSTEIKSSLIPSLDWDYYAFQHGQHISFHSSESLQLLASKFDLYFYSIGSFHLFTKMKINNSQFIKLYKRAGRRKSMFSSRALYEHVSKKRRFSKLKSGAQ